MNKIKFYLIVTFVVLIGGAALINGRKKADEELCPYPLETLARTICLEVVSSDQDQKKGLGGRTVLPDNYGMLFYNQQDSYYQIWMKGMLVPIDIVWLDEEGSVIHLEENVPPPGLDIPDRDLEVYSPPRPSRYVLELKAGLAKELKIEEGVTLKLPNIHE